MIVNFANFNALNRFRKFFHRKLMIIRLAEFI